MANEKKNKLVPMKTSKKPQAKVQIIEMTPKDAGKVPLCGHKDPSKETYQHKFQWIKKRMSEGLKVKMLKTQDDGIVGYIEYVPGEHAWRAVNSEGYMFIHCIYIQWKRCKGRGFGTLLIKECMKDAKKADMNGMAVGPAHISGAAGVMSGESRNTGALEEVGIQLYLRSERPTLPMMPSLRSMAMMDSPK